MHFQVCAPSLSMMGFDADEWVVPVDDLRRGRLVRGGAQGAHGVFHFVTHIAIRDPGLARGHAVRGSRS
ncbi:MAG: hypothetical protein MZV70_39735 [Desulfobacterales bacterium]|nr:hypothetical protein [Desulfobacterales bacterium]